MKKRKFMKKVLSGIVVLAMILSLIPVTGVFASNPIEVVGESVAAIQGESITVEVSVTGLTELGGYDIYMEYDSSKLTVTDFQSNIAGMTVTENLTVDGKVTVPAAGTGITVTGDDLLFTLSIDVKSDAAIGDTTIEIYGFDNLDPPAFYSVDALTTYTATTKTDSTITISEDPAAAVLAAKTAYKAVTATIDGIVQNANDALAAATSDDSGVVAAADALIDSLNNLSYMEDATIDADTTMTADDITTETTDLQTLLTTIETQTTALNSAIVAADAAVLEDAKTELKALNATTAAVITSSNAAITNATNDAQSVTDAKAAVTAAITDVTNAKNTDNEVDAFTTLGEVNAANTALADALIALDAAVDALDTAQTTADAADQTAADDLAATVDGIEIITVYGGETLPYAIDMPTLTGADNVAWTAVSNNTLGSIAGGNATVIARPGTATTVDYTLTVTVGEATATATYSVDVRPELNPMQKVFVKAISSNSTNRDAFVAILDDIDGNNNTVTSGDSAAAAALLNMSVSDASAALNKYATYGTVSKATLKTAIAAGLKAYASNPTGFDSIMESINGEITGKEIDDTGMQLVYTMLDMACNYPTIGLGTIGKNDGNDIVFEITGHSGITAIVGDLIDSAETLKGIIGGTGADNFEKLLAYTADIVNAESKTEKDAFKNFFYTNGKITEKPIVPSPSPDPDPDPDPLPSPSPSPSPSAEPGEDTTEAAEEADKAIDEVDLTTDDTKDVEEALQDLADTVKSDDKEEAAANIVTTVNTLNKMLDKVSDLDDADDQDGLIKIIADSVDKVSQEVSSDIGEETSEALLNSFSTLLTTFDKVVEKSDDKENVEEQADSVKTIIDNSTKLLDNIDDADKSGDLADTIIDTTLNIIKSEDITENDKKDIEEKITDFAEKAVEKSGELKVDTDLVGNKLEIKVTNADITALADQTIEKADDLNKKLDDAGIDKELVPSIQIELKKSDDDTSTEEQKEAVLELDKEVLSTLQEKGIEQLNIKTGVANMKVSSSVVELTDDVKEVSMSSKKLDIDETVTEKLSDEQKDLVNAGHPVFEFKIKTKNAEGVETNVSEFEEKLEISVPYTLKDGEDPEKITVLYLADDGTVKNMRGSYDPVTGLVTIKTNHLSSYLIKENSITFEDIAENWAKKYIEVLASKEIINGKTDTMYMPNANITRAEFTKILILALDIFDEDAVNTFGDVSEDAWYAKYAATAFNAGIVKGKIQADGSITFSGDDKITRQEMIVMLARGLDLPESDEALTFEDSAQVDAYAESFIQAVMETDIIDGKPGNLLAPKDNALRSEAAKVIYMVYMTCLNK
jgi:hypothetical protein